MLGRDWNFFKCIDTHMFTLLTTDSYGNHHSCKLLSYFLTGDEAGCYHNNKKSAFD